MTGKREQQGKWEVSQEEKGGRFQEEELERICDASRRLRRGDGGCGHP